MLDDRHYMRSDYEGSSKWSASPTIILLIVNTVVFALQCINHVYIGSPIEGYLPLSGDGLKHGFVWQLFTFQFLHLGFQHFFFNSLALFMFGRSVERALGNGRLWEIYFSSGVLGGLLQAGLGILFPSHFGFPTVGASAGVSGLLAAFCLLYRDATIRLFFCIPVRAWYVLIGSLAVAAFFVVVPSEPGIAHAAHLGGMLAAIAYFRWILNRERRLFNWRLYNETARANRELETALKKTARQLQARSAGAAEPSADEFISKEVDPILDKISASGLHSLTDRERRILEAARKKMVRP